MLVSIFVRRGIQLLLVVFSVFSLLFVLLHLSGDPATTLAGPDASAETLAAIRESLGLDLPLWQQYLIFLRDMAVLDFGTSLATGVPALELVWQRLPYTLLLAAAAIAVTAAVSVPLGVWSATRKGSPAATAALIATIVGQGIPGFVVGLFLILIFAVNLQWLPVFGAGSLSALVLPTATLAAYLVPRSARIMRSGALGVLGEDYVRTARAKGLPRRLISRRYVLRNSLVTMATVLTLQLAQLLGGAVIVEAIFAWPGMGSLIVESVLGNDFPVVQACVFVTAILVVVVNLVLDLVLPLLDPRLREA
jgi:peptide/nickel transport system permease protein